MKSQINIMRQLQELVLTRDEHFQTGDGSHLDKLNDAIFELQDKLQPQIAGIYERLYKKSHITLAAMSNGCCSVCGMQVPIAQAQQVRLGQHLVTCSSCGRILFAGDPDEARNVAEKPDRDDDRSGISRFSAEELMIPKMKSTTAADAITELAHAMEKGKFIANADALVTAALEREGVLSTAMGNGLAFPHVRGVEGGGLTLAVGVSENGIDWNGANVNVVILSAIPVAVSAFYLRLMGGLVQALSKNDAVDMLKSANDKASLWKAMVKVTRHTVK